jgi:hypothetical protein
MLLPFITGNAVAAPLLGLANPTKTLHRIPMRKWMAELARIRFKEPVSPLGGHIPGIVARRSKPQMIRVHATRHIAAVKNAKPIRNRAAVKQP